MFVNNHLHSPLRSALAWVPVPSWSQLRIVRSTPPVGGSSWELPGTRCEAADGSSPAATKIKTNAKDVCYVAISRARHEACLKADNAQERPIAVQPPAVLELDRA